MSLTQDQAKQTAVVLSEALPYIQKYAGKTLNFTGKLKSKYPHGRFHLPTSSGQPGPLSPINK